MCDVVSRDILEAEVRRSDFRVTESDPSTTCVANHRSRDRHTWSESSRCPRPTAPARPVLTKDASTRCTWQRVRTSKPAWRWFQVWPAPQLVSDSLISDTHVNCPGLHCRIPSFSTHIKRLIEIRQRVLLHMRMSSPVTAEDILDQE